MHFSNPEAGQETIQDQTPPNSSQTKSVVTLLSLQGYKG